MFPLARRTAFAITTALIATTAAFAGGPTPVGTWQSTDGAARYEVSFCGGEALCAQLTWLSSDARTPENVAYLNTYVVTGAQPAAANRWKGKLTYEGNTYNGSVTLTGPDTLTLKGCSLLCKTFRFERV